MTTSTNGNDIIIGTSGGDLLSGGNGNDTLSGGAGSDILSGGNGDDTVNGGSGNDIVSGDNGNDTVDGGAGNDIVSGGNGNDILDGGSGSDIVFGDNGDDSFTYIVAENFFSSDIYDGGSGTDTLKILFDADVLSSFASRYNYTSTSAYLSALSNFFNANKSKALFNLSQFGLDLTVSKIEKLVFEVKSGENHAPVAIPGVNAQAVEDVVYTFTKTNFGFSDVDTNDTLQSIRFTQLPTSNQGQIYLKTGTLNTPISAGQIITIAAIQAGSLQFISAANVNGNFNFSFQVNDGTSWSANQASSNLIVAPVNDAPTANGIPNQVASEDAAFSFSIPQTAFSDVDKATNGDVLTYSVTLANGDPLPSWLHYDPLTHTFSGTPTGADVGIVAIKILATDSQGLSAQTIVNLTVNPTNDAPTDLIINHTEVSEAALVGSVVATLSTVDEDTADTHTYSLSNNTDGKFTIDPLTGELKLASGLDFETKTSHLITVTSTDSAGNSITKTFTINVSNVDDNAPATISLNNNSVIENSHNGFTVGQLAVTDADNLPGTTLSVIRDVNGFPPFSIDAQNNLVVVDGTIDFEAQHAYNITVRATDSAGHTLDQTFTINVGNVDDNAPAAISLNNNSVTENSDNGFTVGQLAVTDADNLPGTTLSVIRDVNGFPPFSIDAQNNLVVDGAIDFEAQHAYNITVRATDSAGHTRDQTFTINVGNVDDNAPDSISLSHNQVTEGVTVGTIIGTLSVSDIDNLPGIVLSILPDSSGNTYPFTIDAANNLIVNGNIDFETASSYNITIRATDSGSHSLDKTFTINVANLDDTNPSDISLNLYKPTLPENALPDTVIGQLGFSDVDNFPGTLLSIVPDASGSSPFAIDANNNLVLNGELNYDNASSYNVTVRATDSAGQTFDKTFTINIANVDPVAVVTNEDNAASIPAIGSEFSLSDFDHTSANGGSISFFQGNLLYTPNANYFGGDSFNYTLTDAFGSYVYTVALDVNAVNDAPIFTLANNAILVTDTNFVFQQFASNMSAGPANEANQTLQFEVLVDNAALFATQPFIFADTGNLTFTLADNIYGVVNVTVKLIDNGGTLHGGVDHSNTQTFTITVEQPSTLFSNGDDNVDFNTLSYSDLSGDIYNALSGNDTVVLPTLAQSVLLQNVFPHEFKDGLGSDNITGQADMNETIVATSVLPNSTDSDTFNLGERDGDFDMVSYREVSSAVSVYYHNVANLFEYLEAFGGAGSQFLINVEAIEGTHFNDWIEGNSEANFLSGLSGNDSLHGGDGNDTLIGGQGYDLIDGGAGSDWTSYVSAAAAVAVNLDQGFALNDGQGGFDTLQNIENILGSAFSDNLTGNAFDNIIEGGLGDDILSGGEGNDTVSYKTADGSINVDLNLQVNFLQNTQHAGWDQLFGFENIIGSQYDDQLIGDNADNIIEGGDGHDFLIGGGGFNTASYHSADSAVNVSLAIKDFYQFTGNSTGLDYLSGFEGLIGSRFDDTLTGDSSDNQFTGGLGDDTINGGAGQDTTIYTDSNESVTVQLSLGRAYVGNDYIDSPDWWNIKSEDTLNSIENVVGSDYRDLLVGDAQANVLSGQAGNDTLQGMGGNDTLLGDAGDDTLEGGDGSDKLTGGLGNDTLYGQAGDDYFITSLTSGNNIIDGGAGFDSLDYRNYQSNFSQGIYANFNLGSVTNNTLLSDDILGAERFTDQFSNIENVFGTQYNDVLIGNANNNVFSIGDENATTLSIGDDVIDGQGGQDTLSFASRTMGVYFDLNDSGNLYSFIDNTTTLYVGSVTLSSIENIQGTDLKDILIGDAADNTIYGNGGKDYIEGGDGNDIIDGGAGADELDGGLGMDIVSYKTSTFGITLSLVPSIYPVPLPSENTTTDTIVNFEGIEGSNFNDTLIGDSQNNILLAGGGENLVYGGAGDDIIDAGWGGTLHNDGDFLFYSNNKIFGESGNDTIIAGAQNSADYIDGGAGEDTVSYKNALSSVNVMLNSPLYYPNTTIPLYQDTDGGGSDWIANVENIIGSDYNDTLTGNDLNNVLEGGAGDDLLDGRNGLDTASYILAASAVTVSLTQAVFGQQDTHGAGSDYLLSIENLVGSNYNDKLTGDANNNIIDGGEGNDWLDGGNGNDTLSFQSATHGVDANLFQQDFGLGTTVQDTGLGHDVLIGFENLLGSNFNDVLTGNDSVNVINGGQGNDTLDGAGGNDHLFGDAGNDTLFGGDGNDFLSGGDGIDFLDGGSGLNVASYADSLSAVQVSLASPQTNIDTFVNIQGLEGSNFNDVLTGDQGNNLLIGGLGNNILDGGLGSDTASYANSASGIVANLSATATSGMVANSGGTIADILFNIENITGSNFNDVFFGDNKNNIFDGGSGDDIVTFAGAFNSFAISATSDGGYAISSNGPAGVTTDTVYNVEVLQFADLTIGVNQLAFDPHGVV